jgi:Helix-turn-helix family
MTPELTAAAAVASVSALDAAWSTDPRTLRRARLLELSGWAFYVAGRGGVLGDDVRPETVTAALGLIAPDAVRAGWDAARKVGPATVAASRLAECARWGEERLSEVADERMVELAERVVERADAVAMPLFAAARAMPAPDGGRGSRAAVLAHLLREHRAGAMLIGIRACGLRPVEAIIAGPEGEQEAITFGWTPPFPTRVSVLRRYSYAEALADRIAGTAYAGLDPVERVELVQRLDSAAAVLRED